ncbi:hypothetical protein [Streptomyces sp. R35]|uniref:Uncharacterized protein n=1 Tax=Streptomyces sp. R35 TaxID=3238630 RepID=A0AB39S9H6_9ACTN
MSACTCMPGATLWLGGPARHAVAGQLAERLRTGHHRRAEVLDADPPGGADESPRAAAERIGLVAEILARNGILAVVVSATGQAADLDTVRDRHRRAGTAFLEPLADPAPSVEALLTLLAGHGLVRAG